MIEINIEETKNAEKCFKDFMKAGLYSAIYNGQNDELLEMFYEFIDLLEDKATKDVSYYPIIVDCYEQVGDTQKAISTFNNYYNPKDKKHIKRMYELENFKGKRATRPSKRKISIPSFTYISKNICKELFKKGTECPICKKKKVGLYVGMAYANDELISYMNMDESFCPSCIKSGEAAKKHKITFNSKYILGNIGLEKQANELVYNTPGIDYEVYQYNEDGWMICCNDFCVLDRNKDGIYTFKCRDCKKVYEILD